VTPRPSYLRPNRGLDPGFLRQPTPGPDIDPGFTRNAPGRDIDPGFSRPQIFDPSPVGDDPGFNPGGRVQLPFQPHLRLPNPMNLQPVSAADAPSAHAADSYGDTGHRSIKDRIGLALEGAGRAGTLDPNSESGTESFIGSALKSFSAVQGFRRQMSANQQAQQDKATHQQAQDEELRARAEYYRGQAHRQPTGQTQQDRIDLENIRQGHMLERIRTAADLRRRQASHGNQGKLSQGDRYVLGRTERADAGANRAVESERTQAERGYRDPVQPNEENDIRSRIRRSIDPNYVSDSTAVADRINPQMGVPRPAAPPARPDPLAPGSTIRSILENYLRSKGVQGGNAVQPRPPQAALPFDTTPAREEPDTTEPDQDQDDTTGMDEGDSPDAPDGDLSDDEITSALGMIEDLGDDEAHPELSAAGYTDDQILKILSRRKSD
jgi:hypothetical protein